MKNIYYLYISIFFFFCFFFISIFIINGNTIFFDVPFYEWLHGLPLEEFFKFITDFGDVFWVGTFVVITFVLLRKRKQRELLIGAMALEVISNLLLKNFFRRERPGFPPLVEASGYSFPSGHMMASTTLALLLISFIWETKWRKSIKIVLTILLLCYSLLIGLSRIYLGVHYTSDVIGGFCISLSLFTFCLFLYRSLK